MKHRIVYNSLKYKIQYKSFFMWHDVESSSGNIIYFDWFGEAVLKRDEMCRAYVGKWQVVG